MELFSLTPAFSGGFWQIFLKRWLYVKKWRKQTPLGDPKWRGGVPEEELKSESNGKVGRNIGLGGVQIVLRNIWTAHNGEFSKSPILSSENNFALSLQFVNFCLTLSIRALAKWSNEALEPGRFGKLELWSTWFLVFDFGYSDRVLLMMTTWPLLVEERALVRERGPGCAGSTHSHCAAAPPPECSAVQWSPVDLALSPCKHLLSFSSAWAAQPPNTHRAQKPTGSSFTPTSSTATSSTSAPTVRSCTFTLKGLEAGASSNMCQGSFVLCSKIIRKWLTIFQSMPCCHDTCWWCKDGKEVQISGLTVSFGCFEWHTWLPLPTNCLWIYSIDYMCKGRFPVWNKYS